MTTRPTILFAIVLIACYSIPYTSCQMPASELSALNDMKTAIPSLQGYWTAADPCYWSGVTCTAGRVTRIEQTARQLSGYLPDSIADISKLQYLLFYNNDLTGTIPASIGNLTDLLEIELGKNLFNGPIPDSFGNLSKLTRLVLNYIGLTGTIPQSIGNLAALTSLFLNDNALTGPIPESIGNLDELTSITFENNELSGTIPYGFFDMAKLAYGILNNNQLNGSIPNNVESASGLRQLQIMNNKLTGTIPVGFGELPQLDLLALANNRLTGCFSMRLVPSAHNFGVNFLCCYDTRYDFVLTDYQSCPAASRLTILVGEEIIPERSYYDSVIVHDGGIIDLSNRTEPIMAECLTINGTIRLNFTSIVTAQFMNDFELIKFSCSPTNISEISLEILTAEGCRSNYTIREKDVGRNRTVVADIDLVCILTPDVIGAPGNNAPLNGPAGEIQQPSTSNQPSELTSSSFATQTSIGFIVYMLISLVFNS